MDAILIEGFACAHVCWPWQVISHGLITWDGRWWAVLLCYEAVDFIVFAIIGWTFRPQEHSPYFFMEEV